MSIETINITLKAVTPIVMSGPDPQNIEFRITEIKGMLRYWYRIRHFDEWGDLKALKDKESEMWGSTEKASKVWLWGEVRGEELGWRNEKYNIDRDVWRVKGRTPKNPRYWWGVEKAYPVGTFIKLNVMFQDLSDDGIEEFFKTLWAMIFLGGVGRRWKRGLGMLDVVLDNSDIPDEYRDYFDWRKRDDVNEFYCEGMDWVGIGDLISVHKCMYGKREKVHAIVRVLDEISDVCVRGKGENKRSLPIAAKWVHVLENDNILWLIYVNAEKIYRSIQKMYKKEKIYFCNCHKKSKRNIEGHGSKKSINKKPHRRGGKQGRR